MAGWLLFKAGCFLFTLNSGRKLSSNAKLPYICLEYSKRSDIPRIFKPDDDESSEKTETSETAKSDEFSDTISSGSGEGTSPDEPEEVKETAVSTKDVESSGDDVKRNVIPTEVFEEGITGYDTIQKMRKGKKTLRKCVGYCNQINMAVFLRQRESQHIMMNSAQ